MTNTTENSANETLTPSESELISENTLSPESPDDTEAPDNFEPSGNQEISKKPLYPEAPETSTTPGTSQIPPSFEEPVIPTNELPSLTLSQDGTYYIVTGRSTADSTHITIPSTYNGIPVTHIGKDAFKNDSTLFTISLRIPIVISLSLFCGFP